MATGTGLDAQIGFAAETTYGTAATVTRFLEFNEESVREERNWIEPSSIAKGRKYKLATRSKVATKTVSGNITLDFANKGMGLLIKHMLASGVTAPTQIDETAAYEQVHTPGDYRGKSVTIQVGRPEPSTGTVVPFTYAGCKFPSWELSLSDGETLQLQLSVVGREEVTTTALATASLATGTSLFTFQDSEIKLGGTASTTSGLTTVSGGTKLSTIAREFSLSSEVPMAEERFGIGNGGLRAEPLENDVPTITGSLAAEFSKTELFDLYTSGEIFPLVFTATGGEIEDNNNELLEIILPAVKLKAAPPNVSGPDIVSMETEFEAFSDGTNPPIQVRLVSADSTL